MSKIKKKPRHSNNSEYEKLKAVWYTKLEADGFNDIEQDENNLKEWSTKFTRKKSLDTWQAKESYYSMAENFLNTYAFENELEKVIWEYHANGISIRNIVDIINKMLYTDTDRNVVWKTIFRLETAMKTMYINSVEGHG